MLARQVHFPSNSHLQLLKRLLRYVAGMVNYVPKFLRSGKMSSRSLSAAADTDWETRTSASDWITAVNDSLFVCRTKKKSIITTSSAEAEYISLFDCANHLNWIRNFYWELANKTPRPENQVNYEAVHVYVDSSAAQALTMNNQVSAKSKHIKMKYYWVEASHTIGIIV